MPKKRIETLKADITSLEVDAIVNAANSRLQGGGGVDAAIHAAAGPELLAECLTIGGCPTGEARITKGYGLKAKFVIHTVGPVWMGGEKDEEALLASCYQRSLALADDYQLKSIAFPAIGTGIYHFPKAEACEIACREVLAHLPGSKIEKVLFVLFDSPSLKLYRKRLA